jgi:hypothetical protein
VRAPDEERTHPLATSVGRFHSRLEAQPARAWFHALRSRHLHVRDYCSGESAQGAAGQGVRGGWHTQEEVCVTEDAHASRLRSRGWQQRKQGSGPVQEHSETRRGDGGVVTCVL